MVKRDAVPRLSRGKEGGEGGGKKPVECLSPPSAGIRSPGEVVGGRRWVKRVGG